LKKSIFWIFFLYIFAGETAVVWTSRQTTTILFPAPALTVCTFTPSRKCRNKWWDIIRDLCECVRVFGGICRTKIQTRSQVLRKKLNKITHSGICHDDRRGRRKHIIRLRRGTTMRNDTIIFHQYPSPRL